jgi:ubiquinone biosynthesis protein COQ4
MTDQSSVHLFRSKADQLNNSPMPKSAWKTSRLLRLIGVVALTRWIATAKSFILMVSCKKQQTPHAMRFLLATEGKTFERSLSAFRATPAGRDLLERRPSFRDVCINLAMLQACPPASLGHWYTEFMSIHGLDEEHYLGLAIENGALLENDAARAWYHTRIDASHDIRHVLSGYGPDVLGEVCLLSFRFGQIRHPGILALVLLGFLNLIFTSRGPVVGPLLEAYRRGRRAGLLDLLPWEDCFAQPLSAHRATLGLTPPRLYPISFAPDAYVSAAKAGRRDVQTQDGILGGNA